MGLFYYYLTICYIHFWSLQKYLPMVVVVWKCINQVSGPSMSKSVDAATSSFAAASWDCPKWRNLQTSPKQGSYVSVSENSGTPKSSILIGFSIINHIFWGTPIFGNTHVYIVYQLLITTHPSLPVFHPFLFNAISLNHPIFELQGIERFIGSLIKTTRKKRSDRSNSCPALPPV